MSGKALALMGSVGGTAAMVYFGCYSRTKKHTEEPPEVFAPEKLSDQKLNSEMNSMLESIHQKLKEADYTDSFAKECIPRCSPMVLMLGNHSSGKSTFINSICGTKIQQYGVSPDDAEFTIIRNGETNIDEDGHTAASTCEGSYSGFEGLRNFGPTFLRHLKLKTRCLPTASHLPNGVAIIDSPGMIDSPDKGREYDFNSVVDWFAKRSAVILLFFDPEKPGTTRQTLQVLKGSLTDYSHKLIIVMNKVDTLTTVRDFARAYGTLCWNLSKVLQNQDFPDVKLTFSDTENTRKMFVPSEEFVKAREDLFQEIFRAPDRHFDNSTLVLEEAAERLLLLATVTRGCFFLPVSTCTRRVFQAIVSLIPFAVLPWQIATGTATIMSIAIECCRMTHKKLEMSFNRNYNNPHVVAADRWGRVRSRLHEMFADEDESYLRYYFDKKAISSINEVLESDLPRLRLLIDVSRKRHAAMREVGSFSSSSTSQ
eukprot:TRINITY_DN19049_c0_g1_i1.p1 TRINITY_DN19049_c0_g1~~TRINITY_DN19049_c0_g1_i1.p1  ORF type:complete len:498 (+),score=86.11 TRINITY_DN19049_c0_g1_i1:47-1495(+)